MRAVEQRVRRASVTVVGRAVGAIGEPGRLERDGLSERVLTSPGLDDAAENQACLRLLTQHRDYGTRTEIPAGGGPRDVAPSRQLLAASALPHRDSRRRRWV